MLGTQDLRDVTAFAAACAEPALPLFEAERPDDPRPREAVATAWEFARGGTRGKPLRDTAAAALKAAGATHTAAGREAAWAAMSAAAAAYLHPLATSTQVKHILGSAAYAARAFERSAGDDPAVGDDHIAQARGLAPLLVAQGLADEGYFAVAEVGGFTHAALRGPRALP